nr:hypothetical protein [Tanacetum cinerariifolium]
MESLISNSQQRELHQLQQMQDKAKESCMASFRILHSLLQASIQERAKHKREYDRRMNDRMMQSKEGKGGAKKVIVYAPSKDTPICCGCGSGALGEPERKGESHCGDVRLLQKQRNCRGVVAANDDKNRDLDAITDNITVTVICTAL